MFGKILLLFPVVVCFATASVTEEQLRSLIQPLLDANQIPKATADSLPSIASMAAASPINTLNTDIPQISPANQQMAQLNLAGGLTNLIKGALGSLKPQAESPAPVDPLLAGLFPNTGAIQPQSAPFPANPILGGLFPNTGAVQPAPAPVQPQRTNMFNPLSLLFPGMGGRSPFGMFMPSMMMRMMEQLMELF